MLIKCTECGKEVSDKAGKCPNCGAPVYEVVAEGEKKKDSSYSIIAAVLSIFTVTFVIGFIVALYDLCVKKDPSKRHLGSYFAIIWFMLCVIALSAGACSAGF